MLRAQRLEALTRIALTNQRLTTRPERVGLYPAWPSMRRRQYPLNTMTSCSRELAPSRGGTKQRFPEVDSSAHAASFLVRCPSTIAQDGGLATLVQLTWLTRETTRRLRLIRRKLPTTEVELRQATKRRVRSSIRGGA
jgi:hypothetical protein